MENTNNPPGFDPTKPGEFYNDRVSRNDPRLYGIPEVITYAEMKRRERRETMEVIFKKLTSLLSEDNSISSMRFIAIMFSVAWCTLYCIISLKNGRLEEIPESVVYFFGVVLSAKVAQKVVELRAVFQKPTAEQAPPGES